MASIFRRPIIFFRRGRLKKLKVPKSPYIHGESIFRKGINILSAEFEGGQTVLFDSEKRTSILINETASRVYAATDGKLDVNGISKVIGKIYDVDIGIVFRDVVRIYRQFFEKGVVIDGGR